MKINFNVKLDNIQDMEIEIRMRNTGWKFHPSRVFDVLSYYFENVKFLTKGWCCELTYWRCSGIGAEQCISSRTERNIEYKPCQTGDLLYRISGRSETKDTSPVRRSIEAISDALNTLQRKQLTIANWIETDLKLYIYM